MILGRHTAFYEKWLTFLREGDKSRFLPIWTVNNLGQCD